MRVGLALPQYGPTRDPARVADLAHTADELGHADEALDVAARVVERRGATDRKAP